MPRPGWLDRQSQKVQEDVKSWPEWMRREAGLERGREAPAKNSNEAENAHKQESKGKAGTAET